MKVKLFEESSLKNLEEAINNFLEAVEPKREGATSVVVDIKYNSPVTTEYWAEGERTANEHVHSAMVIYR